MAWSVRRRTVAAALVVLVLLAGAVLVVTRRSSRQTPVTVTASGSPTTAPVRLVTITTATTATVLGDAPPSSDTESDPTVAPSSSTPATETPTVPTQPDSVPPAAPAYGPNALLVVTNEGDHQTIWAVNPDGTGQTRLLDAIGVADVGWLPGHQQFAWGESQNNPSVNHLHVVNVDGSGDHVLEQRPPQGEALMPWHNQWWSPDGRYVAEICAMDGPVIDWQPLCILDTATGQLRDLTAEFGLIGPGDVGADGAKPWFFPLSWDTTGARLVYLRDPESAPLYVDVVDITTGDHWTLATGPSIASAVVTGDGQSVLYQFHDAGDALQQVPIAGGTATSVSGLVPGFRSPDGQWYLSRTFYGEVGADPPGPPRIFDLAGEVREVPVNAGNVVAAAW